MIETPTLITAGIGLATTVAGVFAGRRMARARASKVEAEAAEIQARAVASLVRTYRVMTRGLERRVRRTERERAQAEHACAARIDALELRIGQLEGDNSSLRAELMARELIDTEDVPKLVEPEGGVGRGLSPAPG